MTHPDAAGDPGIATLLARMEALTATPPAADPLADLGELTRGLAAVREQCVALGGAVSRLASDLTQTRAGVSTVHGEMSGIYGELTELRGEVAELRGQFAGLPTALENRLPAALEPLRAAVETMVTASVAPDALVEERLAVEARLAELEDSLAGVAERGEGLSRDAASTTIDAITAASAQTAAELASLQGGLVELGSSVGGSLADLAAAVETSLGALGGAVDGAAGDVLAEVHHVTSAVLTGVQTAAEQVIAEARAAAGEAVFAETQSLRADLADAVTAVRENLMARVAAMLEPVRADLAGLRAALDSLAGSFSVVAEDVVTQSAAVREQVVQLRGEVEVIVEQALTAMRSEVVAELAGVGEARATLDGLSSRLTRTGRALLNYLVERDLALEAERDRVLHELLADLAAGLSLADRRRLSSRVSELVQRRRDERDAQHWRAHRGSGAGGAVAAAGEPGEAGLPDPGAVERDLIERLALDTPTRRGPRAASGTRSKAVRSTAARGKRATKPAESAGGATAQTGPAGGGATDAAASGPPPRRRRPRPTIPQLPELQDPGPVIDALTGEDPPRNPGPGSAGTR